MCAADVIILYAEDDDNDVFFMKRAFAASSSGHRLKIVRDGREAIDYLLGDGKFSDREIHPFPHLVLLDLKMPMLSGLEVLHWIRDHSYTVNLPVVMFSSSMHDLDLVTARTLAADGYLVKPSNCENLVDLPGRLTELALSPERKNTAKVHFPDNRI